MARQIATCILIITATGEMNHDCCTSIILGTLTSTALIGLRYYKGHTHREQGFGNNGSTGNTGDFTFTPVVRQLIR